MDLPSMSKVTKLSVEVLEQKARSTPVFAPGLENLAQTGAVHVIWDAAVPLVKQLESLLQELSGSDDQRGLLGKQRGGRPKAHQIAERVRGLALQSR
jgi:malonate decarboxylase gamma subunit